MDMGEKNQGSLQSFSPEQERELQFIGMGTTWSRVGLGLEIKSLVLDILNLRCFYSFKWKYVQDTRVKGRDWGWGS